MPSFSASPVEALLALVSEKTHRPRVCLTAELDLVADLHLDSLARIEILAAVRTRLPGLPTIPLADLLAFRTLGEFQAAVSATRPPRPMRHVVTTIPRGAPGLRTAGLRTAGLRTAGLRPADQTGANQAGANQTGANQTGFVVITDDGRGIAHELRDLLAEADIAATVVDSVPRAATGVIFLGGLRDDLTHVHAEALAAAREPRALFVTVQDTGGDFGRSGSCRVCGLNGLADHLRAEWPDSVVRAFDVARGAGTARLIAAELLHGGAATSVGYRDGVRRELVVEPQPAPEPRGPAHHVVVATGRSRALLALARELRPRIVLLGAATPDPCPRARDHAAVTRALLHQSPGLSATRASEQATEVLTGRELRAHAMALSDAGAWVRFAQADELNAVRAEWGPITGVLHTGCTSLLEKVIAATEGDAAAKVCVVLPTPEDRSQAMANEELTHLALAHGWTTIAERAATGAAFVREFTGQGSAQVVPAPAEGVFRAEVPEIGGADLLEESHSPLALLIEWFVAASGASRLRDVSLLRELRSGTRSLTVHGRGTGVALASTTTHGRATVDDPRPPMPLDATRSATVRGCHELGWPLPHARTDPAATDECLRFAVEWAREVFGGTAVPTGVREFRVHRAGPLTGPGKAALTPGRVRDGRAECDVVLFDADDSPRAELLGVSLRRHPR